MMVRRTVTGFLVALMLNLGIGFFPVTPARATEDLHPWILLLLSQEGDPDTPDYTDGDTPVLDSEGETVYVNWAKMLEALMHVFGNLIEW